MNKIVEISDERIKDEDWTLGPVVDADAHIDPPVDMWQEYLPGKFKALAPVIEEGDDCDWIVFEGNRRPVMMINNQAGRTGKDFKMKGKLSEQRSVWDPNTRLKDMDHDGMDVAILYGGSPLGTFNNDLYIASYKAYCRWLKDFCSGDPRRLVPVGYCPMRDIDETINYVKELAEMGFKIVNLPAFPQNADAWKTTSAVAGMKEGQIAALTGDPQGKLQYNQPEFDRLWAVITDLDLTVTMHLGGRIPRFGQKEYFLADMPMSKTAMLEPIGIFIYSGILQRFPKLRLGMIESGVGWMAWYTEYCDRVWEKQRYWTESPLTEPPSYFMEQNIYASFIQDRVGILNRNMPGGKNIMWSSDYPHSETTFPRSRQIILRDFDGVPDEDIKEIINGVARRFYRLD